MWVSKLSVLFPFVTNAIPNICFIAWLFLSKQARTLNVGMAFWSLVSFVLIALMQSSWMCFNSKTRILAHDANYCPAGMMLFYIAFGAQVRIF